MSQFLLEPLLGSASSGRAVPVSANTSASPGAPELSIVIPTFKELSNIDELLRRLDASLAGIAWEAIFVDDDSPDGTAEAIRQHAAARLNVRCIQRIGRRGLSSACVEGMLSSASPYVAVMDADLQHDERILPTMLNRLREDASLDIVVGSRYVDGGGVGEWNAQRASISRWATRISHVVVPKDLHDPMSGFFMMRRQAFMDCVHRLSTLGFKILVDLFASAPRALRFQEVAYTFRNRHAGESKLDSQVAWDYVLLLIDKTVGHIVPARFFAFALIGGLGVGVHMAVLGPLYKGGIADFVTSQTLATLVAMVFNFSVNNQLTYADRRLRGWHWVRGLLSFVLACGIGGLANVGIASYLVNHQNGAWAISALLGIVIGAVWNYAITSVYTWGKRA